ncbi:MAG: ribulokinase [Clostridia bacterium]|nr:ribulokinase [Clostridia bacterium]
MPRYVIGMDYGTLSGRCIIIDVDSGEEIGESTAYYAHGVIEEQMPNGQKLPAAFALQHPNDYLDVLSETISDVLAKTGICASEVIGLGIDFTSCTLLPIDENGTPLCFLSQFEQEPHAYVKLWKHHGAQREADEINAIAKERNEAWLSIYGGKISCEWALPKILETLRAAPTVYRNTARFLEAGDWLSLMLTGRETHSAPFAGYKALWNEETGYPSNDFMIAVDPKLDGIVGSKLSKNVLGMDQIAGYIDERGAALSGLCVGTAVSLPMIDAHAAMPALNITKDGELMIIVGTSACHILNDKNGKKVEGICGYVKDGVIPGYYTYEAGQAAVGDIFDWFIKNCLPAAYEREAITRGMGIHALLREKASRLTVGESGLIALDWWNGNRSVLVDSSLTGMILGLTLRTKPEEIYRALIEATAFGLKIIVDQYEQYGISIQRICAAGGIAKKDDMMMQIYADVLNREIRIASTTQAAALGSAIYAAVAAGAYENIQKAAERISKPSQKTYSPCPAHVAAYQPLFEKYKQLHDFLGNHRIS